MTAMATLRPDGTSSSSSVSIAVAATCHAATNDSSDSTYVYAAATTGTFTVTFGTATLPAGAVTKQIRLTSRGQAAGDNESGGARTWFYYKGTTSERVEIQQTSVTTVSSSWIPVTLTQAEIDGLYAYAYLPYEFGIAARMVELYADITYVTIPVTTVTAVSPDPYTSSNIIPIAWTNTLDSDGGAQTRYHVKVFTDAQYGAGGFSAETSTPYWNSGETVSSSTTINTGALETGDTYRAYVKVAQTVNGASHWSAWAYDTFAVTVTTADVASVTLVASNTTASVAVTVNRDTTPDTAWDYVEVQRTVDTGATWQDVRGATYVAATGSTFAVTDYEVGNGVTVKYRARATRILSGLPITGSWVESSTTSWTSTSAFLKSPSTPALNQTVPVRIRPSIQRTRAFGNFRIVGGDYPVVVSDTLSNAESTLEILQTVSSTSLVPLLSEPVLLFQPPSTWYMGDANQYLAPTDVQYTPGPDWADTRAFWSVSVVRVDVPGDPLASAP